MTFNADFLKLYFIGGSQDFKHPEDLLTQLEKLLDAGITAFQFRDKGPGSLTKDPTAQRELAEACQRLTRQYQVPFFVDDDVNLAIALHAEGIHVGQDDEAVTSLLQRIPDEMFVGLSCKTKEQVEIANQTPGIDYLGVGPIFPTSSKPDAGLILGLGTLTKLVQLSTRPVVAIGGITLDALPDILKTGAKGSAAIRLFADKADPATMLAPFA
ncbi:MAG: thiamine phosphate synthase [Aerococcus sp.]|nr:thiamine phosphate synthase [Aerococcus sp.]